MPLILTILVRYLKDANNKYLCSPKSRVEIVLWKTDNAYNISESITDFFVRTIFI